MVELATPRRWPEAVFHVLAHVAPSASLPASVYDPTYVRFVELHAGPAPERALGEDAALLGHLLCSHELLAQVQQLAWLFRTAEQARACVELELTELRTELVAEPSALDAVAALGAPAEVLRCAAELELETLEQLPEEPCDLDALGQALDRHSDIAPWLRRCRLMPLRPLRLRGRVRHQEIWVGSPGSSVGPALEHVVWQACHEATVAEAAARAVADGAPLGERAIERVAVVGLAQRARAGGRRAEHREWLAHFGSPAPNVDPTELVAAERALLASLTLTPPLQP